MKTSKSKNQPSPATKVRKLDGALHDQENQPEDGEIVNDDFSHEFQNDKIEKAPTMEPWIADMINKIFAKPPEKKLEQIKEKVTMPENLAVQPPRVNPEIWEYASRETRINDWKVQHLLTNQAKAVALLAKLVEENVKEGNKQEAVKITEVITLLGAASADANKERRNSFRYGIQGHLKIALQEENSSTVTEEGRRSELLFGEGLQERLKQLQEKDKVKLTVRNSSKNDKRPAHTSRYKEDYKNYQYQRDNNSYNNYNKNQNSQWNKGKENYKKNDYKKSEYNRDNREKQDEKYYTKQGKKKFKY